MSAETVLLSLHTIRNGYFLCSYVPFFPRFGSAQPRFPLLSCGTYHRELIAEDLL